MQYYGREVYIFDGQVTVSATCIYNVQKDTMKRWFYCWVWNWKILSHRVQSISFYSLFCDAETEPLSITLLSFQRWIRAAVVSSTVGVSCYLLFQLVELTHLCLFRSEKLQDLLESALSSKVYIPVPQREKGLQVHAVARESVTILL